MEIALVLWLVAAVCFIFSLGGLSRHETSAMGNWLGIIGMSLAVIAAFLCVQGGLVILLIALVVGGLIGAFLAVRVEMTSMPQLVAILHSFVGLAAVLVGLSVFGKVTCMMFTN